MTHPYRCTHEGCRLRVSLAMRRERYWRKPRCKGCRHELSGREDKAMRRANKRNRCDCTGYWFPHRRGSLWCVESKKKLTDADYAARYGSAA